MSSSCHTTTKTAPARNGNATGITVATKSAKRPKIRSTKCNGYNTIRTAERENVANVSPMDGGMGKPQIEPTNVG